MAVIFQLAVRDEYNTDSSYRRSTIAGIYVRKMEARTFCLMALFTSFISAWVPAYADAVLVQTEVIVEAIFSAKIILW
jgi:hypothetical protein